MTSLRDGMGNRNKTKESKDDNTIRPRTSILSGLEQEASTAILAVLTDGLGTSVRHEDNRAVE
jgi:hypothetical protein